MCVHRNSLRLRPRLIINNGSNVWRRLLGIMYDLMDGEKKRICIKTLGKGYSYAQLEKKRNPRRKGPRVTTTSCIFSIIQSVLLPTPHTPSPARGLRLGDVMLLGVVEKMTLR